MVNSQFNQGQIVVFHKVPPGSYLRTQVPYMVVEVDHHDVVFRHTVKDSGTFDTHSALTRAQWAVISE